MPVRIQLSRAKGWRMPENTVKVDRTTVFGNPFPAEVYGSAGAVDLFDRWARGRMSAREMSGLSRADRWSDGLSPVSLVTVRHWLLNDLARLRGKNLACWCGLDAPCHADVEIELANAPVCEAVAP